MKRSETEADRKQTLRAAVRKALRPDEELSLLRLTARLAARQNLSHADALRGLGFSLIHEAKVRDGS